MAWTLLSAALDSSSGLATHRAIRENQLINLKSLRRVGLRNFEHVVADITFGHAAIIYHDFYWN